jgi:hypothetical protein
LSDSGALIRTDVGPFVRRVKTALGLFDSTRGYLLPIDEDRADATFTVPPPS